MRERPPHPSKLKQSTALAVLREWCAAAHDLHLLVESLEWKTREAYSLHHRGPNCQPHAQENQRGARLPRLPPPPPPAAAAVACPLMIPAVGFAFVESWPRIALGLSV